MSGFVLEIVEGPGAGRQVPLDRPVEIGRSDEVGLSLDDRLVSRRHARVTPAPGGAVVEDLGSTNGTFVNDNGIHGPTVLTAGDQIGVGVTVFLLRSQAQVVERPSAVLPIPPGLATPERTPDFVPKSVVKPERPVPELDPLLDRVTKAKATMAPIAILVLVALVVILWLALKSG